MGVGDCESSELIERPWLQTTTPLACCGPRAGSLNAGSSPIADAEAAASRTRLKSAPESKVDSGRIMPNRPPLLFLNQSAEGEPNRKYRFVSLRNGHPHGCSETTKAAGICGKPRSLVQCDQLAQTQPANTGAITRAASSSVLPRRAGHRGPGCPW